MGNATHKDGPTRFQLPAEPPYCKTGLQNLKNYFVTGKTNKANFSFYGNSYSRKGKNVVSIKGTVQQKPSGVISNTAREAFQSIEPLVFYC